MHETRLDAPRPADQATEHDEHEWRVSPDAPRRRLRRTADMDWATALYYAYFPYSEERVAWFQRELERQLDDCLACAVDLPPGDSAGSASVSDNLCPHPNPNAGATTPHADPDQGVVVPGRPVRLTYGDGLPGSIATAIPDTDSHLPRLHHPRAAGDDLPGQVWQGGSAHAGGHATAGDADRGAAGTTLGGYG
jgi:hypothetical protein